jgi:hypothetical protein
MTRDIRYSEPITQSAIAVRLALAERAKDYQDLAAMAHIRAQRWNSSEWARYAQDYRERCSQRAMLALTQLLELPQ